MDRGKFSAVPLRRNRSSCKTAIAFTRRRSALKMTLRPSIIMREEDGGGGKSCVEPEIKFEKGPTGRADTDLSFILCKSGKKNNVARRKSVLYRDCTSDIRSSQQSVVCFPIGSQQPGAMRVQSRASQGSAVMSFRQKYIHPLTLLYHLPNPLILIPFLLSILVSLNIIFVFLLHLALLLHTILSPFP